MPPRVAAPPRRRRRRLQGGLRAHAGDWGKPGRCPRLSDNPGWWGHLEGSVRRDCPEILLGIVGGKGVALCEGYRFFLYFLHFVHLGPKDWLVLPAPSDTSGPPLFPERLKGLARAEEEPTFFSVTLLRANITTLPGCAFPLSPVGLLAVPEKARRSPSPAYFLPRPSSWVPPPCGDQEDAHPSHGGWRPERAAKVQGEGTLLVLLRNAALGAPMKGSQSSQGLYQWACPAGPTPSLTAIRRWWHLMWIQKPEEQPGIKFQLKPCCPERY